MVNKVILIGNVGKDPEVKYIKEDVPVARFSLATSESYKKRDGEKVTNTEWHNIVVWRGLAKVVEKYVKKGSKLFIEGKLTYRQYEKDGQTKYFTEIVCRDLTMLDSKTSSTQTSDQPIQENKVQEPPADLDTEGFEDVDDLPF
ncbi:MAG: single-stranded DNA-binding protein [Bacteroidales bacterium]|nr:single-stranded DNA-binding protein [Bacteroidales bacterium]